MGWFGAGFVEVYMHLIISFGKGQVGKSVRTIRELTWSSGAACGEGCVCVKIYDIYHDNCIT